MAGCACAADISCMTAALTDWTSASNCRNDEAARRVCISCHTAVDLRHGDRRFNHDRYPAAAHGAARYHPAPALPWSDDDPLILPRVYMIGVWLSIVLAIGVTSLYAFQVTEQARKLSDALAATELVLAREQHLTQLDGLAAAAAHELGTPLATIAVIVKELERTLGPGSPHADDIKLLGEQARRCRDILAKLTELSTAAEPFDRMKLSAL